MIIIFKDMLKTRKFLIICLILTLLTGTGCKGSDPDPESDSSDTSTEDTTEDTTEDEDFDLDTDDTISDTDWDSAIVNGVDTILIGRWQLTSLTVQGEEKLFKGHTLTMKPDGTMTIDYSTEKYILWSSIVDVISSQEGFSGNLECIITGLVDAEFENSSAYNLDYYNAMEAGTELPTEGEFYEELKIKKIDPLSGPIINCGPGVPYPAPNMTLGVGTSNATGFVSYSYDVTPDGNNLSITLIEIGAVFNYRFLGDQSLCESDDDCDPGYECSEYIETEQHSDQEYMPDAATIGLGLCNTV